ncbi:hypothetical protein, partial [Klebsiella quasipneumoniae]|uniref:hypothetical protein n=1 Tax=Klebsiella quasipneumoniae TaxID=1463165 RepID=UPI001D0D7124
PRALTGLQIRKSPGEYRGLGVVGVALRRCDRGTDAMHLANTPVVSPESKKPRKGGAFVMFKLSLLIAAIAAQLCQA